MKRISLVIAVCAVVGAIAGIAGSAAAPSKKAATAKSAAAAKKAAAVRAPLRAAKRALRRGMRGGPGPGFGGPGPLGGDGPVHEQAVVPNKDGTGFDTITSDGGTLNSVDGTTVHIKEATDKATYKDDVAVDVGSDAKVIRDGADAKLSDLKAGDHVRVITGGPKGNVVLAADDDFIAKQKKRFEQHGFGRGFGPGGPPPGAPAPGAKSGSGSNQNGSDSGSSSGSGSSS